MSKRQRDDESTSAIVAREKNFMSVLEELAVRGKGVQVNANASSPSHDVLLVITEENNTPIANKTEVKKESDNKKEVNFFFLL